MFTALNHVPALPQLQTRKAFLIINLQNDSFYADDDFYITKNADFVPRLKETIPYFRRVGDVIWVRTEMGVQQPSPAQDPAILESKSANAAEQNRQEQQREEKKLHDDSNAKPIKRRTKTTKADAGKRHEQSTRTTPQPAKESMTRASAESRARKRSNEVHEFDDGGKPFDEQTSKPRKNPQARFFIQGTHGAEICDELKESVDHERDGVVIKHHYSAFDQTSLLMSLRMNLVTEIYLCGCLTNAGVYSTAADAVQHGLQVTLIQDCLGYRNESKHQEAIRQMADIMGITGISSEDFIVESGGRDIPDADTPGITLQELSIDANRSHEQASLVAAGDEPRLAAVKTLQHNAEPTQNETLDTATSVEKPSFSTSASPKIDHSSRKRQSDRNGKMQVSAENPPLPAQASSDHASSKRRNAAKRAVPTVIEENEVIGSGDSRIILDALEPTLGETAFEQLKDEVEWQTMLHRSGQVPRLVAVQGEIDRDGSVPIYRHPADESPPLLAFTPTLWRLRREVEKILGQPFNHALIQLYRNGEDNISEHSDKTLDIVRGSSIVNVSLGAQRYMTLRTKKSRLEGKSNTTDAIESHKSFVSNARQSQRIRMPHNSIFVLGPDTNKEWLHGVRADKRPIQEKTQDEKAYGGERISITFRQIGTFMNEGKSVIWGTGAKNKRKANPGQINNQDTAQMEAMINAFGRENHEANFDWDAEYGAGFNVVNLISNNDAPSNDQQAHLTLCDDSVANLRVQLALSDKSTQYTTSTRTKTDPQIRNDPGVLPQCPIPPSSKSRRFAPWTHNLSNTENPLLTGISPNPTAILEGDLAILFHLEKHYLDTPAPTEEQEAGTTAASLDSEEGYSTAQLFSAAAQANELLYTWREYRDLHHRRPSSQSHHHQHADDNDDNDDGYASDDGGAGDGDARSPPTYRYSLEPPQGAAAAAAGSTPESLKEELREALMLWEGYLEGEEFLAGGKGLSVMDYAFWPVLDGIFVCGGLGDGDDDAGVGGGEYPNLRAYWKRVRGLENLKGVFEKEG